MDGRTERNERGRIGGDIDEEGGGEVGEWRLGVSPGTRCRSNE